MDLSLIGKKIRGGGLLVERHVGADREVVRLGLERVEDRKTMILAVSTLRLRTKRR